MMIKNGTVALLVYDRVADQCVVEPAKPFLQVLDCDCVAVETAKSLCEWLPIV